jgi:hypothetical protein
VTLATADAANTKKIKAMWQKFLIIVGASESVFKRVLVESQGVALPNEWTTPDANGTLPLQSCRSIGSTGISPMLPKQ